MIHRTCIAAALALAYSAVAGAQQLSLAEAQSIATAAAPQLFAQSAAVRAARASLGPATELPDPRLIAAVENIPTDGADKYSLTADFMTMRRAGVMQGRRRNGRWRGCLQSFPIWQACWSAAARI